MIKILKSNKLITIFLLIICIFFIIKPSVCSTSCLNAISVWGLKVLPMLFPFFVLTRLIVSFTEFKPNVLDKFFGKVYNTPNGSFFIFFLSIIAGYPMGAKLISTMHNNGKINTIQAQKMLSFCSVSGPMFIIGTVGVSVFNNYKVGIIILISNIIACLINGVIYRGKVENKRDSFNYSNTKTSLSDIVYDSLTSVLMVGAYIILSFVFIDLIKELNVINIIANCFNLNPNFFNAVLNGIIEITRGSIDINASNVSLTIKTIATSSIIAFGGISVFMQSLTFIKNIGIKPQVLFLQKLTQCLICLIITTIICIIFL